MRFFNTEGPVRPTGHYCIPPLGRWDLDDVLALIDRQKYFLLHAPRQTGKTSCLLALMEHLNRDGRYRALYVNIEAAQAARERVEAGLSAVVQAIANGASWRLGDEGVLDLAREVLTGSAPMLALETEATAITGGSAFNVKAKSLRLGDFAAAEVSALLGEHTRETGQVFTPEARQRVWDLTRGQPWLVNALAYRVCFEMPEGRDRTRPVTVDLIDQAKEYLIVERVTHLDQLADKLREERVRRVIEPMLAGTQMEGVPEDDRQYLVDLGLLRRDGAGGLVVANPIYREVLPRALAGGPQDSLPRIAPTWLNADGSLDAECLLDAFLASWRQHGEPLLRSAPYREIAPHLVLMAFLHRVVNGGGTLEREYAIGSGRMDLCLRYGAVTLGMELKVWRDGAPDPLVEGLSQLDGYLAGLGLPTGWLVIFDRRSGQPPAAERTGVAAAVSPEGRRIRVIRA